MEAATNMKPQSDPFEDLESMLRSMALRLVDHPDEVVIFPAKGTGFIAFEVRCPGRDLGALLGRHGAHADAMRKLLSAAATIHGIRVTVQFLALEGDGHAGR